MSKLANTLRQVKPGLLGLVCVALGIFVLLVAGFMGYTSLSGRLEVEQASRSADETAGAVRAHLDSLQSALAGSEVTRLARSVLDGDEEAEDRLFEVVRDQVPSILRLEVYPGEIEQIQPAAYPGPDYAVIDMLLDARRDGAAPAQVHHAGTATKRIVIHISPNPAFNSVIAQVMQVNAQKVLLLGTFKN